MTYSAELEDGLSKIIGHAKTVLDLCNVTRADLEATLSTGTHWRDYSEDVLKLFGKINAMERGALRVIEGADVIRRRNYSLEGG